MRHPWLSPAQKRRQKSVARQLADLTRWHEQCAESVRRTEWNFVQLHELLREVHRLRGPLKLSRPIRQLDKARALLEDVMRAIDDLEMPAPSEAQI